MNCLLILVDFYLTLVNNTNNLCVQGRKEKKAMKSKLLLYIGAATCLASIGAAAAQNIDIVHAAKLLRNSASDFVLTLDSTNTPSGLTSSYQNNFSGNVKTGYGNPIKMNFVNAKSLSGGFAELANHGRIYNFGSGDTIVNAVNGIKFTGSGSLLFKPVVSIINGDALLADMSPISISAGSAKVTVPNCDYFELEAGDSGARISSLELYYECTPGTYDVRLLNGTYTGVGNDSSTYKLTITDGSASFVSLDKQSNVSYNGTAELLSKTSARLSLSSGSITYNMNYDGHNLTYTSKSGSIAEVSFTRVYTLQNFESFSASGQGYTDSTTKYQTTGVRSSFYEDWYVGSGSSEIGGSGWIMMTNTDGINYTSNKGHNNSKAASFKFSNDTQMRYISMNELYGVNSIAGKGTTFSFWVRGAYANASMTTNHGSSIPVTAYAYYETPLTPHNHTLVHDVFEFAVPAGNEWNHFEFDISSDRTYYGFGLNTKQEVGSNAYIVFDDFEIYSADPYAIYVPATYPHGMFKGTFTKQLWTEKDLYISIGNYSNNKVAVILENTNVNATGITYNESNGQVSITTSGTYNNKTVGTITATYSNGELTDIASSCFYNNKKGSASKVSAGSNYYTCDGSTAELQSQFKRQFDRGNGWETDTTNADRIVSDTRHQASGNGGLKLRPFASGDVAVSLNSDLGGEKYKYMYFWVYNPTTTSATLNLNFYKGTNYSSKIDKDYTATANAMGWTYCQVDFSGKMTTGKIYNFQICDLNGTGIMFTFDEIYFHG